MRKDTQARAIKMATKLAVAKRDEVDGWPCCINCGRPAPPDAPWAFSCAHFISRAQGGLGIEENLLTLCPECHRRYDQTTDRKELYGFFKDYLKHRYKDWNEENLVYRKE